MDSGTLNPVTAVCLMSGIIAPAPAADTPGIARSRASALDELIRSRLGRATRQLDAGVNAPSAV